MTPEARIERLEELVLTLGMILKYTYEYEDFKEELDIAITEAFKQRR